MIKTTKHNLAIKLDMMGFSASTICAIHCALMPFILVFLPVFGLQFLANPVVEYAFISASLIIGSFTFKHGYYNHHKKLYPFILFLTGFSIILIGHYFFHDHTLELQNSQEIIHNDNIIFLMIAPLGASIIAASHLINKNLSSIPKVCCEQEQISTKIAEQNS